MAHVISGPPLLANLTVYPPHSFIDLPGAIAAVVVVAVGVVIGLLVTICVIIYTCCRQKRRRNSKLPCGFTMSTSP